MAAVLVTVAAVALYAASIYGGWRIMKWKYRWTALVAPIVLPFAGFLLALFLDARCRHCQEYLSMAASVCPHCGRNVRGGAVTVTNEAPRLTEKPKEKATRIVYDPATHEYVRK